MKKQIGIITFFSFPFNKKKELPVFSKFWNEKNEKPSKIEITNFLNAKMIRKFNPLAVKFKFINND